MLMIKQANLKWSHIEKLKEREKKNRLNENDDELDVEMVK